MADLPKETCEKLKNLGYARENHVHLYGEQVKLLSDPFPHEAGFAVEVTSQDGKMPPRTMKIPLPILSMATPKSA